MATLDEVLAILEKQVAGADALYSKVGIAAVIAAGTILNGADTAAPFDQTVGMHEKRLLWALQVVSYPRGTSDDVFYAVVAANSGASQAAILGASDTTIQDAVNALADGFGSAIDESRTAPTA